VCICVHVCCFMFVCVLSMCVCGFFCVYMCVFVCVFVYVCLCMCVGSYVIVCVFFCVFFLCLRAGVLAVNSVLWYITPR